MLIPTIEEHYVANRQRLVKRMSFRAGSPENGEDVIQEAYTRALKYWRSFNGDNFDNWFSTILNNTLREFKNTEKGYATAEFHEDEVEGSPCTIYPSRIMAQIYEMIDGRSEVQREVLMLFFYQEYSAMDISHITPYTYSQIHQIIQRFRNELKELYK